MAKKDRDQLGERMKSYEKVYTQNYLLPNTAVIARLDGRAFHTFCRGLDKPFDLEFVSLMQTVTKKLMEETNAQLGYCQSDEITLYWENSTKLFFDGKISKILSVLSSLTTSYFTTEGLFSKEIIADKIQNINPSFDCRIFQVPNEEEVANVFLWRQLDAYRNSIFMFANAHFSSKQLHGKGAADMKEMLLEKGIDYDQEPIHLRGGTFFKPVSMPQIIQTGLELTTITRNVVISVNYPKLNGFSNKPAILLRDEEPIKAEGRTRGAK